MTTGQSVPSHWDYFYYNDNGELTLVRWPTL